MRELERFIDSIEAAFSVTQNIASLAGIIGDGYAPHDEALAGEVINLFNDHHFTPRQAEQVCSIIMENLS